MKKLEGLTLRELGDSCLLMEPDEANSLKGGLVASDWVSADEMYAAVDAGTWDGGWVTGMGYVLGTVLLRSSGASTGDNSGGSSDNSSPNQTYYSGTDQWQSTINVPSNHYDVGSAIDNANRNQPSQTGDDTVLTPFGEDVARHLLELLEPN